MDNRIPKARLVLEGDWDEQAAIEAEARGVWGRMLVEVDDGNTYAVMFYDDWRLVQELHDRAQRGLPFLAYPGMIVLESVTLEAMQTAVDLLGHQGFFGHLKPWTKEQTQQT